MRLPVPGPRFDWRMSGRPGSSSFCSAPVEFGNPISGNCDRGDAPAALEHAEDVRRRNRLPRGQRGERWQDALRGEEGVGLHRIHDRSRQSVVRVRLAEDVALVREDAVVVRGAAPEHRGGRHEASLGGLDDREVAGAARLARRAKVARIHEAHELGALAVEQRIGALGRGARRPMPCLLVPRAARGPAHEVEVTGRLALTSLAHRRAHRRRGNRCSPGSRPGSGASCAGPSPCGSSCNLALRLRFFDRLRRRCRWGRKGKSWNHRDHRDHRGKTKDGHVLRSPMSLDTKRHGSCLTSVVPVVSVVQIHPFNFR